MSPTDDLFTKARQVAERLRDWTSDVDEHPNATEPLGPLMDAAADLVLALRAEKAEAKANLLDERFKTVLEERLQERMRAEKAEARLEKAEKVVAIAKAAVDDFKLVNEFIESVNKQFLQQSVLTMHPFTLTPKELAAAVKEYEDE